MKLLDLIFGKKKIIKHPFLGKIESEPIFGENPRKNYNWSGTKKLGNSEEEVYFILNGNYSKPDSRELNFIVQFIENLERKYLKEIVERFYNNKIINNKPRFSKAYSLSAIISLDNQKFEIIFINNDKKKFHPLGVEFNNGIITKVYEV